MSKKANKGWKKKRKEMRKQSERIRKQILREKYAPQMVDDPYLEDHWFVMR